MGEVPMHQGLYQVNRHLACELNEHGPLRLPCCLSDTITLSELKGAGTGHEKEFVPLGQGRYVEKVAIRRALSFALLVLIS